MTAINPQAIRGPVTAVPVVAGKGVRFVEDVENNRVVAEVDETVLWTGNGTGSSSFKLSEPISNFEFCRFKIASDQGYKYDFLGKDSLDTFTLFYTHGEANAWSTWLLLDYTASTNNITVRHSKSISHSFTANTTTLNSAFDNHKAVIIEVVGINRISA